MQPIFNEYIQFLQDKGVILPELQEGYYWIDRQIIRAFDLNGKEVKIARLKIDDKLNITFKRYKEQHETLETWNQTIERNMKHLKQLENDALNLIEDTISLHPDYSLSCLHSSGKDSSITHHLVKQVMPNIPVVFNNTSLDCADSYKFIKQIPNVTILSPETGFYQWRKREWFIPTRLARSCCSIYKEKPMIEQLDSNIKYLFFMGMRNAESSRRSTYQDIWQNNKWSNNWTALLPIRTWTDLDVWLYILWRDITFNIKYRKGYSRVGCAIACPFYTKSTWVLDKYWYPTMYQRWQDILTEDFIKNNKALILNCTLDEYYTSWNGGVVRPQATPEVIREFADMHNLDYGIAEKYFENKCVVCDKKIKKKQDVAMNLKLLGRNTSRMYCKKHLQEMFEIDNDKWNELVGGFEAQECELF